MKTKTFEINILADNLNSIRNDLYFGNALCALLKLCDIEFHQSPVIGLDASYYVIKFDNTAKIRILVRKVIRVALSNMYFIQKASGVGVALDVEMFVCKLVNLFVK